MIATTARTGGQYLATTSDGGVTLTTVDPQPVLTAPLTVSCPAVGTCERVGFSGTAGLAERSTDGGSTWTPQSLPLGTLG